MQVNQFLYIIFLCIFFNNSAKCLNNSAIYSNIEKIDEDFIIARMESEQKVKLWLVMERITPDNSALWLQYINVQTNLRAVNFLSGDINPLDGSSHFKLVLEQASLTKNDVWAAYITKADFPKKIMAIKGGLSSLYSTDFNFWDEPFAKNIEMFVTVTSSKEALITSHMGIAVALEAIGTRQRGISLDLHSFAAKVMLNENPRRRFMVNAPVFAMENIIIKALPHHTYVGTREMRRSMQEAQGVNFADFSEGSHKEEFVNKVYAEAQKQALAKNKHLEEEVQQLHNGKRPGETIPSLQKAIVDRLPNYSLIKFDGNNFVPSKKKIKSSCENRIREEYLYFKNPFVFKPAANKECASEEFLKFMERYPPILSSQKNVFTIFEPESPETPWLTIDDTNNQHYDWMSTRAFAPAGITHYIAVDLKALADSRSLIELEKDARFYKALGAPYSISLDQKEGLAEHIEELKNNTSVVDLTIHLGLGSYDQNELIFREALKNKPNLRNLTIVGDFPVELLFESRRCIGNMGTCPWEFLAKPHLQFFSRLNKLRIDGNILGCLRNDAYFLIDFIGHLEKSNQLEFEHIKSPTYYNYNR